MFNRILTKIGCANRPLFALMLIALAIVATGCNDDGGLTGLSKGVVCEDTTPPEPPAGIEGLYLDQIDAVRLSWSANQEPDLAGYILYRENGDDIEALITEPALVLIFQDGDVPDGANRYCLRAVDLNGNESATCSTIVQVGTSHHGDQPIHD